MAQTQQRVLPRKAVKVTAPAVKPTKFFKFAEGKRPTAGARLFAFTEAALSFLGLREGQKASKEAAVTLMGTRMVQYHTDNENFVERDNKIALTKQGKEKFDQRIADKHVDPKMVKAFTAAIKSGKPSAIYDIPEKALVPVTMAL